MPTRLAKSLMLPALLLAFLCASAAEAERAERLRVLADEVSAAERDFAQTMAERDLKAFAGFVAEDAVFRSGRELLIGRSAVVEGWRESFNPGPAPFSWEPDRVTVADSGATAISSGPVHGPDGRVVGRFTTIWRKESAPDGGARWRVIVDQGVPLIECAAPGH